MRPILYSFRRCPYAMRARMAIYYSGVECELREVTLKNKPISLLDASSKGTVPVLVDGDRVIEESLDIIAWALARSDPDAWLTHAIDHDAIQRNDGEFKYYLDRYKYFDRYPEQPQSWYFSKALEFLTGLEAMLTLDKSGHHFLMNSKVSVLDIAMFPFIRQFAFVDKTVFDAQDLPKLQAWLAYFLNSPLFLNVMEKYAAWHVGQDDCILFGT